MDSPTRVLLPDGRTTSIGWDDVEAGGQPKGDQQPVIVAEDRVEGQQHKLPEEYLRARVRGWMEVTESPDRDWYIGAYTADGKWIWASSGQDRYTPLMHRIDFCRRVCRHLNRQCANDGAWLTGWIRGGVEFYCLWKDKDGDIQIPIEFDKPFTVLQGWTMDDFSRNCGQAHEVWREFNKNLELRKGQAKKVSQGERTSPVHNQIGPRVAGLEV